MFSDILPFMRCPRCYSVDLRRQPDGLACNSCGTRYPIMHGILDMLANEPEEIITPFQRLMQTPLIVSIYERLWRRAGYYLASSRSFESEMETVLRLGKSIHPALALDLACGTGVFTRPLARIGGGTVVGVDLSWPMLTRAQQLVKKEKGTGLLVMRATAFSLPFADSSFPYVNCCGALHLFDRPADAIREIRRILKPGGHLCVQTIIRPSRSAGFAYFLERFIRFGFFDEIELRKELEREGFRILENERHRISFTFLAKLSK